MEMFEKFLLRFQKAVADARRDIEEVELIAVSKKKPISDIQKVYNSGQYSFGENQIQEIEAKWPEFRKDKKNTILHFVGSIQSRKTHDILDQCDVIHSIDRLKIVKLVKQYEETNGIQRKYFLQINTGSESQKSGVLLKEADKFIQDCKETYNLKIAGLMCLPPQNEDPTKHFNILRGLAMNHNLASLSMGMSHDFEEAIKCGATQIRIGTAIFGKRA